MSRQDDVMCLSHVNNSQTHLQHAYHYKTKKFITHTYTKASILHLTVNNPTTIYLQTQSTVQHRGTGGYYSYLVLHSGRFRRGLCPVQQFDDLSAQTGCPRGLCIVHTLMLGS